MLVLYPTSYVVWLLRTVFARRVKRPLLLSGGKLVDPRIPHHEHDDPSYAAAAAAMPLIERVGEDELQYCEDVLVWDLPRVAIFSSDPGRRTYNAFLNVGDAANAAQGRLMLYNLDDRSVAPLEIACFPAARAFHPVGIGMRENGNGNGREAILAVANMSHQFCAVETLRLTFDPSAEKHTARITATFIHSLASPWLCTPNAVVPLSEESVLVSNSTVFSGRKHSILNSIETMCALPLGSVLFLSKGEYITREEGAHVERVSSCIAFANGLALSPDGSLLVVAASASANVHVYDIDPPASSTDFDVDHVRFRETIPVGFCIDNLRFQEATGTAYVFLGAGHPVPLAFAATSHSMGEQLGPSHVVKITIAAKHSVKSSVVGNAVAWLNKMLTWVDPRVQTVFQDDGELLSSSATAVGFAGKNGRKEMLVAGLWDKRGAVHCVEVDI
jgi:hypothetical protein